MDGTVRSNIKPGTKVQVVQKQDQRSGKLTDGIVKRILTNSAKHPRGIKVMLEDGTVGRVQNICEQILLLISAMRLKQEKEYGCQIRKYQI